MSADIPLANSTANAAHGVTIPKSTTNAVRMGASVWN
jgi:hypothetical protein